MAISTVKVTINGIEYDLIYDISLGRWVANLISPSEISANYYDVSITAIDSTNNSITVDSTHPTFGSSLRLYVVTTDLSFLSIQPIEETIKPCLLPERFSYLIKDVTPAAYLLPIHNSFTVCDENIVAYLLLNRREYTLLDEDIITYLLPDRVSYAVLENKTATYLDTELFIKYTLDDKILEL